jgi:hypothetical protein
VKISTASKTAVGDWPLKVTSVGRPAESSHRLIVMFVIPQLVNVAVDRERFQSMSELSWAIDVRRVLVRSGRSSPLHAHEWTGGTSGPQVTGVASGEWFARRCFADCEGSLSAPL